FGIQARGGCSCAGPYGHRLLGIDAATSRRFEDQIAAGCEVIKPGWVRINFNYFIPETEFEYLVDAVHLVAEEGWKLLPRYRFEATSGVWRHRDGLAAPPLTLAGFLGESRSERHTEPIERLAEYLAEGRRILGQVATGCDDATGLPPAAEPLRWFPLPAEAAPR